MKQKVSVLLEDQNGQFLQAMTQKEIALYKNSESFVRLFKDAHDFVAQTPLSRFRDNLLNDMTKLMATLEGKL